MMALARLALGDARQVAAGERRFLAVALLIASAPGVLAVFFLPPSAARGPAIVSAIVTFYLQLLAMARTLHALGAMPADYRREDATERRFPAAFVAELLYLVATAVGLVLLVVPGLAVFLLGGFVIPALLAERLSIAAAFRRSIALVRPRLGAVAALALVSLGGILLSLVPPMLTVLMVYALALPAWVDRAADAMAEVTVTAFLIGNAMLWAAAFSRVRGERPA